MCKQNNSDQGAFTASSFSSWLKIDKIDMYNVDTKKNWDHGPA